MCKYSYLSGACANRRVESLHCVGEDECEHSGMNILGSHARIDRTDPGSRRWLEHFCKTHGRYMCDESDGCVAPAARGGGPPTLVQRRLDEERESW